MNFDIKSIKLSNNGANFFHNGRNTTCEYHYCMVLPTVLEATIGWIYGSCKATVKCHDEDEYDQNLGEKLALAKAEARAYRLASNELLRRMVELKDVYNSSALLVGEFLDKAEKASKHNLKYIKSLTNTDEQ